MDLSKLRYFARVVEARSMSKAAESLHVAQPALSKSLRALGEEFGFGSGANEPLAAARQLPYEPQWDTSPQREAPI